VTKTLALALVAALLAVLSSGCGQKPQDGHAPVARVERQDELPLPRRNYLPRNLDDCPDQNLVDGEDGRRLYGLVTQTTRGEVALVDLLGGSVVDEEPAVRASTFSPWALNRRRSCLRRAASPPSCGGGGG